MKKLLLVFIGLFLVLSGCQNNDPPVVDATAKQAYYQQYFAEKNFAIEDKYCYYYQEKEGYSFCEFFNGEEYSFEIDTENDGYLKITTNPEITYCEIQTVAEDGNYQYTLYKVEASYPHGQAYNYQDVEFENVTYTDSYWFKSTNDENYWDEVEVEINGEKYKAIISNATHALKEISLLDSNQQGASYSSLVDSMLPKEETFEIITMEELETLIENYKIENGIE